MANRDLIRIAARKFPDGKTFDLDQFIAATRVHKDSARKCLSKWVALKLARIVVPHDVVCKRVYAMEPLKRAKKQEPSSDGMAALQTAFPGSKHFTAKEAMDLLNWDLARTARAINAWVRCGAIRVVSKGHSAWLRTYALTDRDISDGALLEMVLGELEERDMTAEKITVLMSVGIERAHSLLDRWLREGWVGGSFSMCTVGHKWLREREQRAAE